MADRKRATAIDPLKCTGCGLCIRVCPDRTLAMIDDRAAVTGERCMHCGHCAAVCPADAVHVAGLDNWAQAFETFRFGGDRWLPPGRFDTPQLVSLMRSRRSCRNFLDTAVDSRSLEDLVKIGITAPSGTNSQKWTFTILPDRPIVLRLGAAIGRFFERLNRIAGNPLLRGGSEASGTIPTRRLLPGALRFRPGGVDRVEDRRHRSAVSRSHGWDSRRFGTRCQLPDGGRAAGDPEHSPGSAQHGPGNLFGRFCRGGHAKGFEDKGRFGHSAGRAGLFGDCLGSPR